jgi:non-specific serine/threonine protein kinase
LFVDRARAIDPSFALTEANAGPVVEICARTDGLPLAIELVAGRMRIFPVATLAARLRDGAPPENSGPTDKPARHQSLHTLTATSFRLLDQEQQHLLTRMSVCAGDMSLQTVEAIGAMPGQQTERALEALVDLNLVVVRHGTDEPRFAVLETVRVFCKRELKQRGELRKARRDHADHFRELAENARPHLTGSEQGHWIRTLAAANGDLRAAVDFLRETDRQAEATATVLALHRYWLSQGYLEFGAQHLAGANAPGETGAALAMATGAFAVALGDVLRASESFHRAAIAYGENGDQDRSNSALAQHYAAGCHAGRTVDPGCVKNVIRSSGRHDAPIEIGDAALALGVSSDDLDRSADLLEAASEVYARRKDARGAGLVLAEQAEIAVARNEFGAAERLFRLSLEQLRSIREQTMLPTVLDGYALLLWQQVSGQEERVVRVLAGSSALRKHTNAAPLRIRRSMPSGPLRQLRRTLGVPEFDMLWNEGRRLTPDAAAAEMLSAPLLLDTHRATATPQDAGLTPRQFQIASLVAQGMTNRQIARNLQISEWTAVNHVRQIMRKLGLPSRIHIAQWLLTVNDPDSPH